MKSSHACYSNSSIPTHHQVDITLRIYSLGVQNSECLDLHNWSNLSLLYFVPELLTPDNIELVKVVIAG